MVVAAVLQPEQQLTVTLARVPMVEPLQLVAVMVVATTMAPPAVSPVAVVLAGQPTVSLPLGEDSALSEKSLLPQILVHRQPIRRQGQLATQFRPE